MRKKIILMLLNENKINNLLSLPIKTLSILIFSTIVTQLAAWLIDYKYSNFYPQANSLVKYSDLFSPAQDGGYFEHFQLILILWCVILSSIWIIKKKYYILFVIPSIYSFLLLDDFLLIHDRVDRYLVLKTNFFTNYPLLSEYFYWLIVFIIVTIFSVPPFIKGNFEIRNFLKVNFIFFILLSFFALFIDSIKSTYISFPIKIGLMIIEECGEIIVISCACIWLFSKNLYHKYKN